MLNYGPEANTRADGKSETALALPGASAEPRRGAAAGGRAVRSGTRYAHARLRYRRDIIGR